MRIAQILLFALFTAAAAFSADAALLNLVMPEARVLGGMDVERARDSVLGRKMMEQMTVNEPEFAKLLAATGFDPRRDLREVVFATVDTKAAKNAPMLMLVRGVFDTPKISGFVKSAGMVSTENVNGIEFFTKAGSKEDGAFAFIDSSLAIAGTKDAVRAAIQRRGGKSAPMQADTYAKVQSMSRDNDIWMVSSIPVAELSKALPDGAAGGNNGPANVMKGDAFKSIEQVAFGVRFAAQMMNVTAEALSATDRDATAIADVVRFLSTMVQMNRDNPDVKGLATALDSMKLTTDARTTRMTISIPTADLEKMVTKTNKPNRKI